MQPNDKSWVEAKKKKKVDISDSEISNVLYATRLNIKDHKFNFELKIEIVPKTLWMYTILTKSLYTHAASYTNHQIFEADIMHHKKCMERYLRSKFLKKYLQKSSFLVQLQTANLQLHQKWAYSKIFFKDFDHGSRTAVFQISCL